MVFLATAKGRKINRKSVFFGFFSTDYKRNYEQNLLGSFFMDFFPERKRNKEKMSTSTRNGFRRQT